MSLFVIYKSELETKLVMVRYKGKILRTIGFNIFWIMVMFLSVVWSFILTAPIHCRGSIGEQVM